MNRTARFGLCFVLLLWGVACTTTRQVRQDPNVRQATFSLQKLSCEGCGARVVRVLKQKKGIAKVSFDKHKVELQVAYNKTEVTSQQLIKYVEAMGFGASQGAGQGAYLPPVKFDKTMDVQWIAKEGEAVDLKKHLATGKVTIFDFYAVWCGPCKDVDHAIYKLLQQYADIALRKLNVVDWNRPLVKQHLTSAGVSQLPYLLIYDHKGQLVQKLIGRKIEELQSTITKLAKQKVPTQQSDTGQTGQPSHTGGGGSQATSAQEDP